MKYKILLVLFLFLFSCSPQKRINRIVKNNPYLLKKDTVKVTDTFNVIIPGPKTDSLIYIEDLKRDTVFIRKDNLTIKTIIKNDTLFVSGECDTIIKEIVRDVLVPYESVIAHKPRDELRWLNVLAILTDIAFFILLFVFIIMIRQLRNRI